MPVTIFGAMVVLPNSIWILAASISSSIATSVPLFCFEGRVLRETWGRAGSLLNRADPTPYSEVNFLLVPKFPIKCVPQFRRARSLYFK
jgi:hypothetical protein